MAGEAIFRELLPMVCDHTPSDAIQIVWIPWRAMLVV